jgi:hypothetical protein
MKIFVANAFSLSMLDRDSQRGTPLGYTPSSSDQAGCVARMPRPVDDPADLLRMYAEHGIPIISVIGHADTAAVMSSMLGRELVADRRSIQLEDGDLLLVGQYIGPRLPEGATALPDGARIEWWVV